MPGLVEGVIDSVRKNPVFAVLAALSAVVIGVAKTTDALDSLSARLFPSATSQVRGLLTTWQGSWSDRTGDVFRFAMQVAIDESDSATGRISWQLVKTDRAHLAARVNDTASEWVSGNYLRPERTLVIAGDSVSDPTLIITDQYRFKVSPDSSHFRAMTRTSSGVWAAAAEGDVILQPASFRP